jgi:hypothetical protein
VEACVGIDEIFQGQFILSVFPNPTNGIIQLLADFNEEASPVIRIFDTQGNRLFTGSFTTTNKILHKQFDLSQYPGGIYYLQMIIGNKSKTIRIIKTSS